MLYPGASYCAKIWSKCEKLYYITFKYSIHWICVANMNSGKPFNQVHYIFYSLFSWKRQQDVVNQIAAYSFSPENELLFHVMLVQQQQNAVDYELFCKAFATSLAFAKDQSHTIYGSIAIQPHLIKCLTSGKIVLFPKVER